VKDAMLNLVGICGILAQGAEISLGAADAAAGCGEQLGYFALF